VLRTNELQTWFLSEHLVSVPLVKMDPSVDADGGDSPHFYIGLPVDKTR
jgi:hypothetical protein